MKKGIAFLTLFGFIVSLSSFGCADDERVKSMTQEALRLYSERQYIQSQDLFNQVKRIDPANSIADEYLSKIDKNIADGDSAPAASKDASPTWDSLLNPKAQKKPVADVANAKDIIAARRSLVEKMKNRSMKTENIVQIQDSKGGINITLFHDQLFLPGLQILRDEALPILDNVATMIRAKGDKLVTIQSLARTGSTDPFLLYPDFPVPAPDPTTRKKMDTTTSTQFNFQDIEATRSFILFTYLAQKSMGKTPTVAKN